MRSLRDDERGSATAELVLLTPVLIMMLLFIIFCGRLADANLRLEDAAHQAARAASLARSMANARNDAHATASAALANAGITCLSLAVTVHTAGFRPGGIVSVEVTCTVGLSDLALLGMPGSTQLSASFSSPVDTYRGTTANVGGA
ncbi:pilus assembly protein [Amycolatopsis rubida]|uniref:Pilus assembly protein n=1 Tax=Amycolatopsis rubida TaxID=112413 RepID=A0ABX0BMX7_9PSEU|nr:MULTISPECIES: TadE family protein [Amycolatopsis]MYW90488.1 pilus assembly protein TadE [Amycolatopsis rubida]MYW95144.1 pilus assembly protein TadE [Amycolatopsis rubida]NEC55467.1 pilus assembly protein [Amycolatopsis rubida]NEC60132.1 pilus assembly protein [Amycolatopsis rubida]